MEMEDEVITVDVHAQEEEKKQEEEGFNADASRWYLFLLRLMCSPIDPMLLPTAAARQRQRQRPWGKWALRFKGARGRPPRRLDYDLEAGGQAHREEAKTLRDIFGQVYSAFLAASAMSYSAFKDAPEHVKFIIFGGLVIIYIVLIAGMLSRSLARRQLAFRLVSCSAVTLLTFSIASQLSETTFVVLTALVGGLLNLGIMLFRF